MSVCFRLITVCTIKGTAADGVWANILWTFYAVLFMKVTVDFEDNIWCVIVSQFTWRHLSFSIGYVQGEQ